MEPVIGSARLFAALENLGQSPGAEMRSPWGPSGMPSEEAQRAFQEAMDPPASLNVGEMNAARMEGGQGASWDLAVNAPTPEAAQDLLRLQGPAMPGPAEFVPGPQQVESPPRVEGAAPSEGPHLDQAQQPSGTLDGGMPTPVELYQLQYQVGMLRAQLGVMLKSSQSLTQSLETTLKQSG